MSCNENYLKYLTIFGKTIHEDGRPGTVVHPCKNPSPREAEARGQKS